MLVKKYPYSHERDAHERHRQPQHPPRTLQHQQDQRDAEDCVGPGHVIDVDDAVDDVVVVDEDVADRDDADARSAASRARLGSPVLLSCSARCSGVSIASCSSVGDFRRIPEKRQHHREHQMDGAEDVVGRRAAEHLAQRRRDEIQRRDDDVDVVERHRQGDRCRKLARPLPRGCAETVIWSAPLPVVAPLQLGRRCRRPRRLA